MGAIEAIKIVLSLVPALISAISAIEEAIPGQGKGEQKLAAIRGIIETGNEQVTRLWPMIEGAIAALIKVFNATGAFKKAD